MKKKLETKDAKTNSKDKNDTKKAVNIFDENAILRWKAPDYYTFEKSPLWSLAIGLLAIILSLVLIYTSNYFPVIIIILAVIVTFQVAHEKPKTQEFAIDKGGVLSRETYFPFLELKSFWIARHDRKTVLYLEPVNRIKSSIVIPLGKQNSTEVRNFLLQYLPEKLEGGELISDKLIRIFKL